MLIPSHPVQGPSLLRPLLGGSAVAAEARRVSGERTAYFALDGVLADVARAALGAEVSLREYRQLPGLYLELPTFPDTRDALKRTADMGYAAVAVVVAETENQADDGDRLRWVQRHHPELTVQRAPSVRQPWGTAADLLVDARGAESLSAGFQGQVVTYEGRWNLVLDALRNAANAAAVEVAEPQRKQA